MAIAEVRFRKMGGFSDGDGAFRIFVRLSGQHEPFVTATLYNDLAKDQVVNYIAPSLAVTPTSATNFGTYGELSAGVNCRSILEATDGGLRELSASLRGDVTFNDNLLGGRVTANLRLRF